MTITFVGSNTKVNTTTTQPTTLSLPASVQGDLVVVIMGCHRDTSGGPTTTAGYTSIVSSTANINIRMEVSYKFMGATPDTSVTFPALDVNDTALVAAALVFRGVHSATPPPMDVPPVLFDDGYLLPVVAEPIRPVRDNGCVVIATIGIPGDTTVGSVAGFLPSPSVQCNKDAFTLGAAYRIAVGGAGITVTPGPWSTWTVFPDRLRFVTVTIALRALADIVPVSKSNVTFVSKAVTPGDKVITLKEIIPVSRAQVGYTGKVITVPDATIDAIFVGRYKIALTGKSVNIVDVSRAVTVNSAAVLCRGGTVAPREILSFEDVPYLTIKGRGSEVFMETR